MASHEHEGLVIGRTYKRWQCDIKEDCKHEYDCEGSPKEVFTSSFLYKANTRYIARCSHQQLRFLVCYTES